MNRSLYPVFCSLVWPTVWSVFRFVFWQVFQPIFRLIFRALLCSIFFWALLDLGVGARAWGNIGFSSAECKELLKNRTQRSCIEEGPPEKLSEAFQCARKKIVEDGACSFDPLGCARIQHEGLFQEAPGSENANLLAAATANQHALEVAQEAAEANQKLQEALAAAVVTGDPNPVKRLVRAKVGEQLVEASEVLSDSFAEDVVPLLKRTSDQRYDLAFNQITAEGIESVLGDGFLGAKVTAIVTGNSRTFGGYRHQASASLNLASLVDDSVAQFSALIRSRLEPIVLSHRGKNNELVKSSVRKAFDNWVQKSDVRRVVKVVAQRTLQKKIPKRVAGLAVGTQLLGATVAIPAYVFGASMAVGYSAYEHSVNSRKRAYGECSHLFARRGTGSNGLERIGNQPSFFRLHQLKDGNGQSVGECSPVFQPSENLFGLLGLSPKQSPSEKDQEILNALKAKHYENVDKSIKKFYGGAGLCQYIFDLEEESAKRFDSGVQYSCGDNINSIELLFEDPAQVPGSQSPFFSALGPYLRVDFDRPVTDTDSVLNAKPVRGHFLRPELSLQDAGRSLGSRYTPITYFDIESSDLADQETFVGNFCVPKAGACRGDGPQAIGIHPKQKLTAFCESKAVCRNPRYGKTYNGEDFADLFNDPRQTKARSFQRTLKNIHALYPRLGKHIARAKFCCLPDGSHAHIDVCQKHLVGRPQNRLRKSRRITR